MYKKKLKILGTIIAFIFCFVFYYLYSEFPCFLTSIFSPVNKDNWEYTKILFSSIIFSGVTQKITVFIKKIKINNICFSNFVGAISSIPIFIILFLLFYNLIKININIIFYLMFITIIIAEIISYIIMGKKDLKLENKTIFFVIFTYVIYLLVTYFLK